MMISSADFLKVGKLSQAIRDHQWFKDNPQVYKIFPQINLADDRLDNWRLTFDKPQYVDYTFGNLKIGFSSSTPQGLYDIATMSMRGIASCQSWEHSYHTRLVGSVADPFCGLVYLTDGSNTEYGLSIIKRSVVRLIVGPNGPALFIERVYSKHATASTNGRFNNADSNPRRVISVFRDYIQAKTKNKLPIYTSNDKSLLLDAYGYFNHNIPVHKSVRYLYDTSCLSYVDSGIPYKLDFNIKPLLSADEVFNSLQIN